MKKRVLSILIVIVVLTTIVGGNSIFAHEHVWPSYWTTTVSPTCISTGLEVKRCEDCNALLDIQTIPATGHSMGSWYYDHCYWDDINLIWVDVFRRDCSSCSYYVMSE